MYANKMQELDSSYGKETTFLLELLLPSSSSTKKWKGGGLFFKCQTTVKKEVDIEIRPLDLETVLARGRCMHGLFFIDITQITNFGWYESQNHLGNNLM